MNASNKATVSEEDQMKHLPATTCTSAQTTPRWSFSVVSHRQGGLIQQLLLDLNRIVTIDVEVIVTLNLPEDEAYLGVAQFPVRVIRNHEPKGFGANHNAAFARSTAAYFCVLNPDLRLPTLNLGKIEAILSNSGFGACSPRVENKSGSIEDSARKYPTVSRILARIVNRKERLPDYAFHTALVEVDWIAGMFMAFNSAYYCSIRGFDERYFMYLEDADICRRLRLAGFKVAVLTDEYVVHEARRASRKNFQHFVWHINSMIRFLARMP